MKNLIKKAIASLGYRVSKIENENLLNQYLIEHVFDVGANVGQFRDRLRNQGYKGQIISFEPQHNAHAHIVKQSRKDAGWVIHPKIALGAEKGRTSINISRNTYSSSILPMLQTHQAAAPESVYVGTEEIKVDTLESIFGIYTPTPGRSYVKIDTQGFESQVLEGAKAILPEIFAVQLELSIIPLYEGAALYDQYLSFFERNGFVLWDVEPGFRDPVTSRLLQFDGTFVNSRFLDEPT